MSGFLKLPTELACEIVEKWLCLKDVVRLDSAFCHNEMRNVLHKTVFQSPLCILAIPAPIISLVPAIFKWVSTKCIRLSTLYVTNGAGFDNCEDYLKRFGDTVQSVTLNYYLRGIVAHSSTLVARYCSNLQVLAIFNCDLRPCVDILKSCAWLRSINISSHSHGDFTHLTTNIPATHHLQIASINLRCSEEAILGMCDPLCVQRLRLAYMTRINWHTFVNLRSFSFVYDSYSDDENVLTQICTLCPWIVNLAVSGFGSLADEVVVPAMKKLNQLRTFGVQYEVQLTDLVLHALIAYHKHTLEAVYLLDCDSLSESAINRLLKECMKLHTMSCTAQADIDYSLMSNLTTLIMNFPSVDVWNGVQQHCHSLQSLHLVPPQYETAVDSHIIVTQGNLPVLRTVYTAREHVHDLRLQLPSICVVEEEDGNWYDLFELPI